MFVALEGIDACGKGTQTELLASQLKAKKFKFPDENTPMGKLIYSHLRSEWACFTSVGKGDDLNQSHVDAMAFQALQLANRMEHAEAIRTSLSLGVNVVADRYWASGIVYGGADGLDTNYLTDIQRGLPLPDLNVLIDIPPELSEERRPEQRDRYEAKKGFMAEVRDRYHRLWETMREYDTRHWTIVDGTKSVIEVQADIMVSVKRTRALP